MRTPSTSAGFTALLGFLVALPSFGIDTGLPALTATGAALQVTPAQAGLTANLFMLGFAIRSGTEPPSAWTDEPPCPGGDINLAPVPASPEPGMLSYLRVTQLAPDAELSAAPANAARCFRFPFGRACGDDGGGRATSRPLAPV